MTKQLDAVHMLILDLLEKDRGGKGLTLRKIAEIAHINHPQKVLNKIHQLERMGYIRKNHEQGGYDVFRNRPIPEFMTIPMYSSEQFFHTGFTLGTTRPIRMVKIPSDILEIPANENYFFIKIKSKSLLPIIKPDDLVLIKEDKHAKEGKKYLVIHNNVLEKKVLHKIGKELFLVSSDADTDTDQALLVKKDTKILGEAQKAIISL